MVRLQRFSFHSLLLFVCTLALGCGGPELYPVSGTVVFEDEQPAKELVNGVVELESPDKKTSARGVIDAEGKFQMKTYNGAKEIDGAPPGVCRVLVAQAHAMPDGAFGYPPQIIDPRFERFDTSNLEVTIARESNQITLKVGRVKPAKK